MSILKETNKQNDVIEHYPNCSLQLESDGIQMIIRISSGEQIQYPRIIIYEFPLDNSEVVRLYWQLANNAARDGGNIITIDRLLRGAVNEGATRTQLD